MVICLERGADLHMVQLMPLPLTVSCSSKIQIGFTFLVPAHLGSPIQRAVKRVCVQKWHLDDGVPRLVILGVGSFDGFDKRLPHGDLLIVVGRLQRKRALGVQLHTRRTEHAT